MNQTLKMQVEETLDLYPETRNSDIALLIQVWKRYYPEMVHVHDLDTKAKEPFIYLSHLYDLPREDGVKRVRAQIQNDEKKYLPTEWKIAKQRGINEDVWKKALGYYVENTNQMRMFA